MIDEPATEGFTARPPTWRSRPTRSPACGGCSVDLANHSDRTPEQVRQDIERDKILTVDEAKEYGLIDDAVASRKLSANR